MLLLGIDVGTSSVKAILLDSSTGKLLVSAGREYPIHQPAPDYAEQNPDDWWDATIHVVQQVVQTSGRRDVGAIGLTGQMHGTTLLDKSNRPLHPSIIWADQRSGESGEALAAKFGVERYTALAGTLPAAGFLASTLYWLTKHNPALLERTNAVVLPKDYVRFQLVGEIATDISDAAATGLFDIVGQRWSDEIIAAVGVSRSIFPEALPSAAVAGALTKQAAERLGLASGIPVVAGCADQPAQAVANGVVTPGMASVTTGTGGQVSVPVEIKADETLRTDPRLHVFNHAKPNMAYILGAILAAGLNLRWFRNLVGLESQPDAYALLSEEAASIPPGSEGLLYLPYLVGERTPHMDPLARGAFIGLSYRHTRAHLARAVMEGVAFALRQTLEISLGLSSVPVSQVIAAGGGAESVVWRQIMADVLGLPLQKTAQAEQTCVGTAVLAGIGTGAYADFDEGVRSTARFEGVTEPNPALAAFYNDTYAQFCGLYPRLRQDFHDLTGRLKQ